MTNLRHPRLLQCLALTALPWLYAFGYAPLQAQEITYPTADGGTIHGLLYGRGEHAVLLAHGRIFNKESWAPLAEDLVRAGHRVLAIDFRGYGKSVAGSDARALDQDVLDGIRYLHREQGATRVSVLGGSMGGGASARAATRAEPGEISSLILLSAAPINHPERLHADRILFIASEGEAIAPQVRGQYDRAPEPKELVLLPGGAHAQHIFKTDQAGRLTEEILRHLDIAGR